MSQNQIKKEFNLIINGLGGQGIITLTRILAMAALIEGNQVKTSELHGLSQRGGSVETHLHWGEEIFSPLVSQAGADLIISLEAQEALKACYYASKKAGTIFLVNDSIKPILGAGKTLTSEQVVKQLKKFSKKVILTPGSSMTEEKLGKEVLAGVYLLSLAIHQKLIPLEPGSLLRAIEKVVSKEYLAINRKAFNLAI